MSALGKGTVRAREHVRRLRGISQPVLIEATDGILYVVKFHRPDESPNLPFNESLGHETYRVCGLATPLWSPVEVSAAFLERYPECWWEVSQGRRERPEPGIYFGARFQTAGARRLLEILPGDGYQRVLNQPAFWTAWVIDVCAHHADHRQALFSPTASGEFEAIFIDHSHMFGGPVGNERPDASASRYLDPRVYLQPPDLVDLVRACAQRVNIEPLQQSVEGLPADWKVPSALTKFEELLSRLSDPHKLQQLADVIAAV